MARPRRLVVAYLLGSLLLLPASLHPPTAYAAPGDPPSGSPAGSVYQLPLEQGRSDAAPKGSGGTAAGGSDSSKEGGGASEGSTAAGGEEAGSTYRSENNFGSSSRVPGAPSAGTGAAGAKGSAGGGGGKAGGEAAAGGAGTNAGAPATETAGTGNTSVPASVVLLGAIALLAIAAGILTRRFSGRRAGS
jgi:hypothetical protein